MGLEDVLRQSAEINEFLESLVVAHERALQDQDQAERLDAIRQDILICFDELCTLNDMLTSCDGQIRDEIRMLQKCKDKITKLNRKRDVLLEEREKWTSKAGVNVGDHSGESKVVVNNRYRGLLNGYLDLVGAANTSLVEDQDQESEGSDLSRETVLKSMQMLQSCHDQASQSVKQLKELLRDFQKDQAFIEREMKVQSARIRRETGAIDDEIMKINVARKNVLAKAGIALPDMQETSTAQKLFNFKLSDHRDRQKELEQEDIASHANEFLDMKIVSLQDQLTHRKDDSYKLSHMRDSWSDCMDSVKKLEDRIRSALTGESIDFPAKRVGLWIEESVEELSTIMSSADNKALIKLVGDEKEVIGKAYQEISRSSKSVEPSSPPRNNHSSPPFLVANKSPPKIGISDKTAQSMNNDNGAYGSNSLAMLMDKSQKKD